MVDLDRSTRQAQLVETLVTLADTFIDDYDVAEVLQDLTERCEVLVGADAAAILLGESEDHLELVASSTHATTVIEMMQLGAGVGPCLECYRSGRPVSLPDLDGDRRWPEFRDHALQLGFRSLHAVPLRLRETTIGSLGLFKSSPGELAPADAAAARALADMATIGILHERALQEATVAQEQLQRALNSRIIIEQAKGVVAYRRNVDVAEAFSLIRQHARDHGQPLSQVAEQIVARKLSL